MEKNFMLTFFALSGNVAIDQIITILLSTSMFVGGATGFFLDNTVPGNLVFHSVT
jgi:hypothetical protein